MLRNQRQGLADRRQHAEAEDVHLQEPERFEIVLVPLNDRALVHRGVLDRHQFGKRTCRDDEATDMLRKVTRKTQYLVDQQDELTDKVTVGVDSRRTETLLDLGTVVPPGHGLREKVDEVDIEAERLADVADGAARPIGDERRGERRPVPAIALVDVLDHLLAPLVLEVDVDVRRLVALLRHEALEQEVHPPGVHLGDPEAVAHRRVGGRTAALAEDALAPGETDDVVDGEEEVLVAQIRDELQFPLDEFRHVVGRPGWPADKRSGLGELAEVCRRRQSRRHQFLGVLVAQFVQAKRAAVGQFAGLREHLPGVDCLQGLERLQVAFTVLVDSLPEVVHRTLQTNGGQHVLKRFARGRVHDGAVAGDHRQVEAHRKIEDAGRLQDVVAFREEFKAKPKIRQQ